MDYLQAEEDAVQVLTAYMKETIVPLTDSEKTEFVNGFTSAYIFYRNTGVLLEKPKTLTTKHE
jgi:hypothetical protein